MTGDRRVWAARLEVDVTIRAGDRQEANLRKDRLAGWAQKALRKHPRFRGVTVNAGPAEEIAP